MKRFYWDKETIKYFANILKGLDKYEMLLLFYQFVEDNCELQEGEKEMDLVVDLYKQVKEYLEENSLEII